MKKIIVLTAMALFGLAVLAEEMVRPRIPVTETTAYKKRFGGDVIQPGSMKGCVVFFDATKSEAAVDKVIRGVKGIHRIDAKSVALETTPELDNAANFVVDNKASVGIFIIEKAGYPIMLVSPESRFAFVNLLALKVDSPEEEKLDWRLRKMLWRAFAYTCGGGASEVSGCVMNPIFSLKDLDSLDTEMVSPDGCSGMNAAFKKLGISPFRRTTYKVACQEGWAPAPTNEFQKAIWDKVHEIPSEPLKIKRNK